MAGTMNLLKAYRRSGLARQSQPSGWASWAGTLRHCLQRQHCTKVNSCCWADALRARFPDVALPWLTCAQHHSFCLCLVFWLFLQLLLITDRKALRPWLCAVQTGGGALRRCLVALQDGGLSLLRGARLPHAGPAVAGLRMTGSCQGLGT